MTKPMGGRRAAWTRALLVGTMLSGAIVAAPLGGAKADMQDDINALKAENAELREMVKNLMQDVQILRNSVQSTNEAVQAAATPKAPEKMVSSGRSDVQVTVSGHVDRELLYVDDGDQSQIFNADNKTSTSRLNVTGKAKLSDDLTAGATIEVEIRSNDSGAVTMSQESEASSGVGLTERKVEVFMDSKTFGKLYMGQGPQATDGVSEVDLSGTSVISSSSMGPDQAGSVFFRREGSSASSGFRPRDLFDNFDSSRRDRIRYDTPSIAGFTGVVSYSDSDIYDYALWYGGDFNGWKVAAAVGYEDAESQPTGFSVINTSGAVLAPFGTSLQGGYAEKDFDVISRNTNEFWWIKLGQEFADWFPIGSTAFSVAYAEQSDQGINNSEGSWWNVAAVQAVKKASTELFFSVGQYDADIPNIPTEEMFISMLGARLKF